MSSSDEETALLIQRMERDTDGFSTLPDSQKYNASEKDGKVGLASSMLTLLLAFFGIGILTLPFGFRTAGVVGGCLTMVVLALVSLYSFQAVIQCKNKWHQRGRVDVNSFDEIGSASFGRAGLVLVNVAVMANQIGIIAAYLEFVGVNLNSMIPQLSYGVWTLIWGVPMMLLGQVRDVRVFGPTSAIGLLCLLFVIISVFYTGISTKPVFHHIHLGPENLFLFVGMAALSYSAIAISVPVENAMAKPKQYPMMLYVCFIILIIVYCAFGTLGYLFFGQAANSVISLNITGGLAYAVKSALVVMMSFNIPVNCVPLFKVVESFRVLKRDFKSKFLVTSIVRAALVMLCAVLAFGIPQFGLFSNLVGAVAVTLITFLLPPLFHLKTFGDEISFTQYLLDVAVMAFGLCVGGISATETVIALVEAFTGSS